jgi:putative flippase GtrA
MIDLAKKGLTFLREHDLKTVVAAVFSRDAHPLLQFAKYGFCGVAALVTHNSAVYLIGHWWVPFGTGSGLSDAARSNNQILANLLAFPLGNAVAYTGNALWVFTGGRHSRVKEFTLFTVVSLIAFVAGLLGGPWLIRYTGISHHLAQGGFVVTSALVNFVVRKFFVFAR